VLQTREEFQQKRYQHLGRFDGGILRFLDRSGAKDGAQFKYKLKKDGGSHGSNTEMLRTEDFRQLLDHVEAELVRIGREIYDGVIALNPYQKGRHVACERCDYKSICRFDPWTQPYRMLPISRQEAVATEK
jgi:ATP-dependent helicase/nuclease subunit B